MADVSTEQRPRVAEHPAENAADKEEVPIAHAGPPVWASTCGSARVVEDAKEEPQGDVQGKPSKPCCSQKASAGPQAADGGPRPQNQTSLPGWAWVLFSGAAVGALFLLRQLRQRSKSKSKDKPQPVHVPRERVFCEELQLPCPPPDPLQPRPLAGRSLVVSDRVDVEGVRTRFGSDAWRSGRQPRAASHAAVGALVGAGAQAQAVVPAECLGLGPLLSSSSSPHALPNPAGKGRSNGGGEFGAAVAVAAGHADLALAVDELGTARVPAACCGVYAFRPTAGVLPLEGASTASHSLAVPALLASDPHVLLRAGEALRLPGGGSRVEVPTYLVVEDYFSECGAGMRSMLPAVINAVKRWAGPDQAQGLSLCQWLYHRVQGLRPFVEEAQQQRQQQQQQEARRAKGGSGSGESAVDREEANGSAQQQQQQQQPGAPEGRTGAVLGALAAVAEVVQQWEFAQKYGEWVQVTAGSEGVLQPEVPEFQERAQQVGEERYRSARAVMAELSGSIRQALQEGYIFVLPTTPGEAPPAADAEALSAFRQRSAEFSALAALAGVAQVTVPLPVPGQLPLSVSLMSLHKKDLMLLHAAAKLGPLLAEEAAKLVAQQGQQPAWRGGQRATGGTAAAGSPAVAAAAVAAGGGGVRRGGRGGGDGKKGGKGAVSEEQAARAEACKEDGNTAFRAGRYEEAVRQYSAAIRLDPKSHVYYANRALAHLKLGWYSLAEEDCDLALQLELNVKALLRRGSARMAQGDAEGAKADFKQALSLEPQNRQAREELTAIQRMEAQLQPGGF